jgi:sucrose-6-phosphate hydrolase SacC (GH32 family)
LHFSNAIGQTLEFRINQAKSRYELDRSNSGITDFFDGFTILQTAPMPSKAAELDVRVLIDRSSVEVFVNGGETVMTALVFPETPYEQLALVTPDRVRIDAAAYRVPSIWSEDR